MTEQQARIINSLQRIDELHSRGPKLLPVILLTLMAIALSVGGVAIL